MQLAPVSSWRFLRGIVLAVEHRVGPTNLQAIVGPLKTEIPAIGIVVASEISKAGTLSKEMQDLCTWVWEAAIKAFGELKTHSAPPKTDSVGYEEDWRKVSTTVSNVVHPP